MKIVFKLPKEVRLISESSCLLYEGTRVSKKGYPWTKHPRTKKTISIHRIIFEKVFGYLPQEVHHTCENKKCLNARHFRGVSSEEHTKLHFNRTHCSKGHELTPANIYWHRNIHGVFAKECRTCRQEYYQNNRRYKPS